MAPRLGRRALVAGAVSGELPDLDVVLTPLSDPALPFALHRHFTHALAFVPIGAAIALLPMLLFRRGRERPGAMYLACLIGYLTHAPLDTCTTYGTHLYWPFLSERSSWDLISIVDPIFTGCLLIAVLIALFKGHVAWFRTMAIVALAYLGLGLVQHQRADRIQEHLLAARGHTPSAHRVAPTLGNLIVWRSVYAYDGVLYADDLRLPLTGRAQLGPSSTARHATAADIPTTSDPARTEYVFERSEAFATGLLGVVEEGRDGTLRLGDMRYSIAFGSFAPIWGLEIRPGDTDTPVRAINFDVDTDRALPALWRAIIGRDERFVPVTPDR